MRVVALLVVISIAHPARADDTGLRTSERGNLGLIAAGGLAADDDELPAAYDKKSSAYDKKSPAYDKKSSAYDKKSPARGNDAMIVAGMVLFTAAYLPSFAVSAYFLDYLVDSNANAPEAYAQVGGHLIPFFGPVGYGIAAGGSHEWGAGLVSIGMAQLGGLIMMAVGVVDKPARPLPFNLAPTTFEGGGGLIAIGRF